LLPKTPKPRLILRNYKLVSMNEDLPDFNTSNIEIKEES